jgi:diacylglycerol kinase (ATP)
MKIHVVATIIVILGALFLRMNVLSIALLSFAVSLVWVTELINTAVEALVDLLKPEKHPLAKIAKDVAAGAVFAATVNAGLVGYLLFINHLRSSSYTLFRALKSSYFHTVAVIFVIVAILVIALKSIFKTGTPLEGGKPSGHSALAFSAWVAILVTSDNIVIVALAFFISVLVAQSRIKNGIHTFKEVIYGGVLGAGVTYALLALLQLQN